MKPILRSVAALMAIALLLGLIALTDEKSRRDSGRAAAPRTSADRSLLEWLPPGCKSALWVDVRGLHTAPALAGMRQWFWNAERLQAVANFKKSMQIDLRNDLDELIVCFDLANPSSLLILAGGGFDTAGFVRAFRRSPAVRAQSYHGAEVLALTDPKNPFECVAVLGPHQLAGGSRAAVTEVLDSRGKKTASRGVAGAGLALAAPDDGALARFVTTQLASLPKVPDVVLKEHNKLLALAAGLDGDSAAVLRVRLEPERSDDARRDAKFLRGALDLLCGSLQAAGKLPVGVDELLSSVKIEQQASAVTVSARVPVRLLEDLLVRGQN